MRINLKIIRSNSGEFVGITYDDLKRKACLTDIPTTMFPIPESSSLLDNLLNEKDFVKDLEDKCPKGFHVCDGTLEISNETQPSNDGGSVLPTQHT